MSKKKMIGIDLFAGAGGLSLGAEMAGINVAIAVENDKFAAQTYQHNHPHTHMIVDDIQNINKIELCAEGVKTVLFGGPPCQGYSTSNQKTRNKDNPKNWLFQEFIRIAALIKPDWILFENVRGITETEKGFFCTLVEKEISQLGYTCSTMVLCASDYGVPQVRSRFFLIGSRDGLMISRPSKSEQMVTVKHALWDLPNLDNGASADRLRYNKRKPSRYAKLLRGSLMECSGHLVSKNAKHIIERYSFVPQGGNWESIPDELMANYKDKSRCHTGIYKRLNEGSPSITVGNYRKSMLIHPWANRGLSVREAARLQSFPDSYQFGGSIGFQQQQVGNAVPPFLAKAVFHELLRAEERSYDC